MKVVGKRRMAREMALQMLYQSDLGEAPRLPSSSRPSTARRTCRNRRVGLGRGDGRRGRGIGPAGAEEAVLRRGDAPAQEVEEAFEYARSLVEGAVDHRDEIDGLISEQADNWRLERMPAVDRNILRLAVYELLYEEDIPKLVIVDEAIELAKKFSTDQSSRFVNGLLDGLLKKHTFPGTMK